MAITKIEYQELLKKSFSFKKLDALEQAKIMGLEGEEMEFYAKLYKEEEELMRQAAAKFVDESQKVIDDFKIAVKKDAFSKLKNKEEKMRQNEEKNLNNLLKNI